MENLPTYISIVFVVTTLLTVFIFYKASHYSATILIVLLSWLTLQGVIGISGFYTIEDSVPPRFVFLLIPALLGTIILFSTAKGRKFIDNLDQKTLTILHIIRVPVELVLFWLFLNKTVPQLMTFEGRNFDVLSGLTAPLIYYFGFVKHKISPKVILAWNIICLGLLLNIVINAILSAPLPFQKFAFDQPNIAILYFPFIWLPCCVVPLVLFSHLAAIRSLTR
jgi:hypothetical protein